MRAATRDDLPGIAELLAPLEQKGILKPRTRKQLKAELPHYTVIDLEARMSARGCPPRWLCLTMMIQYHHHETRWPLPVAIWGETSCADLGWHICVP